jgi:subtilisin family serine protease
MIHIIRRPWHAVRLIAAAGICAITGVALVAQDPEVPRPRLHPLEYTDQLLTSSGSTLLADASALINVNMARARMKVSGNGFAAVVIDSGVYASHATFCGRVKRLEDFTGSRHPEPAVDRDGHGTHVAGIIAASGEPCNGTATGLHPGMAPGAVLYSFKATDDQGGSDWPWIGNALRRVLQLVRAEGATPEAPLIGAVNVSIGSFENLTTDNVTDRAGIIAAIRDLTALNVPVVVAAGNDYYQHGSQPGMAFPAIVREAISVGAVFNKDYRNIPFGRAYATRGLAGRITPFSQRLPIENKSPIGTTLFAPGAEIISTGLESPVSPARQRGTSQAAPMVTGTILLMDEYYNRRLPAGSARRRPPVGALRQWLTSEKGSALIVDNYGDDDNVKNTDKSYRRLDVLAAIEMLKTDADRGALPQ